MSEPSAGGRRSAANRLLTATRRRTVWHHYAHETTLDVACDGEIAQYQRDCDNTGCPSAHVATMHWLLQAQSQADLRAVVDRVHIAVASCQRAFTCTSMSNHPLAWKIPFYDPQALACFPTGHEAAPFLSDRCINHFCWRLRVKETRASAAIPAMQWINVVRRACCGFSIERQTSDARDLAGIRNELAASVSAFP